MSAPAATFAPTLGQLYVRVYDLTRLGRQTTLCAAGVVGGEYTALTITSSGVTAAMQRTQGYDEEAPAAVSISRFGIITRRAATDADLAELLAAWNDPDYPPWMWWARLDTGVLATDERERIRRALEAAVAGWYGGAPAPTHFAEWRELVLDRAGLFP